MFLTAKVMTYRKVVDVRLSPLSEWDIFLGLNGRRRFVPWRVVPAKVILGQRDENLHTRKVNLLARIWIKNDDKDFICLGTVGPLPR
jgi:hypothetical protein